MKVRRASKIPAWIWAYGAAVFALWTIAVATGENNAATVLAFALVLPVAPFVEIVLLVVFSALRFDPTTAAPQWQVLAEAATVVLAMTAAAVAQAILAVRIVGVVRDRCCCPSRLFGESWPHPWKAL